MNNIIFSNLTQKQVLEEYNNKEYTKTIQLLRNVFVNRNNFLDFLNNHLKELDVMALNKFREILHIWTVKDEFKALLDSKCEILTVAYMQEYDKDYVKEFFNEDEIKKIKVESTNYFFKQKNLLLLKNYMMGNFGFVMNSLKYDYASYEEFESKIAVNGDIDYKRHEIAPLRELAHIYKHANFSEYNNDLFNYKYAALKYLLFIYTHLDIEYTERYLLRQKSIGLDLESLFLSKSIVYSFSDEEQIILKKIYINIVKDNIKNHKGKGLFYPNEYSSTMHMAMNVLELDGTDEEKSEKLKVNFNYSPYMIKKCFNSKAVTNGIKDNYLQELKAFSSKYDVLYGQLISTEHYDKEKNLAEDLGIVVMELLNSNADIDTYFNQNYILKKEYEKIKKYLKKYCPQIYQEFVDYRNNKIKMAAIMVVNAIRNNRDFSEIDYYRVTNIPYKELLDYLKGYNYDAYYVLNIFATQNPRKDDLNDNGIEIVYNNSQTYQAVDRKGNIVNVEATTDDKRYVVNYLKNIGAPITVKNISCGLRRLLNGRLSNEDSYEKRITL